MSRKVCKEFVLLLNSNFDSSVKPGLIERQVQIESQKLLTLSLIDRRRCIGVPSSEYSCKLAYRALYVVCLCSMILSFDRVSCILVLVHM